MTAQDRKCWIISLVIKTCYTPTRKTPFLTDFINTPAKVYSNVTSHSSVTERQTGPAPKTAWQFPYKVNRHLPRGPLSPALGIYPRETKTRLFTQRPVCSVTKKGEPPLPGPLALLER